LERPTTTTTTLQLQDFLQPQHRESSAPLRQRQQQQLRYKCSYNVGVCSSRSSLRGRRQRLRETSASNSNSTTSSTPTSTSSTTLHHRRHARSSRSSLFRWRRLRLRVQLRQPQRPSVLNFFMGTTPGNLQLHRPELHSTKPFQLQPERDLADSSPGLAARKAAAASTTKTSAKSESLQPAHTSRHTLTVPTRQLSASSTPSSACGHPAAVELCHPQLTVFQPMGSLAGERKTPREGPRVRLSSGNNEQRQPALQHRLPSHLRGQQACQRHYPDFARKLDFGQCVLYISSISS
jgi:hypothetical protein